MPVSGRNAVSLAAGLFTIRALATQTPVVGDIMLEVAKHQDQAQRLREKYSYTQKVRIRAIRGDGKLSREEYCVYSVAPTDKLTKKELVEFKGRYQDKGRIVEYQKAGAEIPNRKVDVDASLVPELRDGLINDKESRDGLAKELFPLTSTQEKKYQYEWKGEETFKGRQVYRIQFEPKKEFRGFEEEQTVWAGEVLVDKAELQPISVVTHMAKGLPFFVRTALGTNVHQLGFAVTYRRFDEHVYFPVSYGGEFDVKVVFLYKRTFTISLENTDFRRGEAESRITYAESH